jgi:hypothetical protein
MILSTTQADLITKLALVDIVDVYGMRYLLFPGYYIQVVEDDQNKKEEKSNS